MQKVTIHITVSNKMKTDNTFPYKIYVYLRWNYFLSEIAHTTVSMVIK